VRLSVVLLARRHYDLAAHDELMSDLERAGATEKLAGDPGRCVEGIGGKQLLGLVQDDPELDFIAGAGGAATAAAERALEQAEAQQAEAQAALDGATKKKAKKKAEEALAERTAAVAEARAALEKLQGGEASPSGSAADQAADSQAFVSARRAGQAAGEGSGVQETGSTLANLARTLEQSGVKHDGTIHDNREDEALPLDIRLQGAKELFNKTKHEHAGWGGLSIQNKRVSPAAPSASSFGSLKEAAAAQDAMYEMMHMENADQDMLDRLPTVSLNSIFSKRL